MFRPVLQVLPFHSSHDDPEAALATMVLIPDPLMGLTQAAFERRVRLPAELLLDERVIAVATGDPARGAEIVTSDELHAGDRLHFADELVDGHELAGSEVDRRCDQVVAVHDRVDALDAIRDVHEAPGLLAVAPGQDCSTPS